MIVLQTLQVTKSFGSGASEVAALRGVDLSISSGEFVVIMGPSGCGKSTLLHLLAGIEQPTSGRVLLEGRNLNELNDDQRSVLRRRRIGFVFQKINLLPTLTAVDNVALPLRLDGISRRNARPRALAAMERAGILHRADHRPHEMSGGEAQRVAIARALAIEPAVILGDEPTGALDTESGQRIVAIFRQLVSEHSQTVIVVTHDPSVASVADRVIRMRDGIIVGRQGPLCEDERESTA